MKKNDRFAMSSAILMGGMAILAGCMNGVYTIDSSIDCDDEIESMPYELVNDKADPFKDVLFKEDTMPVVVNEVSRGDTVDSSNLTVFLWGLTLGVFPAFESHTETYDLSVITPIGKKSKSYSSTKRSWMGWIPIVVPVPGWGVSRWYFTPESKEAEEQRDRTLRLVREKTIKAIVGEFSSSEYQNFAKNKNDIRAKELVRIKSVKDEIDCLIAKNKFDEAEELRATESEENSGTWACDKDTWNSIKQEIANKKEDYRVANKKTELEKLFGESKFEDVVAECEKECGGEERHMSVWAELKTKAERAISERDRKIELARIAEKKLIVEKLLAEKRYAEVISQCDEEKGECPGSREEDAVIWSSLRTAAADAKFAIDRNVELTRINKVQAKVRSLLDGKKYSEVVTICEAELSHRNAGWKSEDQTLWSQLLHKGRALDRKARGILDINGFYLGMSVRDAHKRLSEVLPDISRFYVRDNGIFNYDSAMPFCKSEHGRVVMFNFYMEWLERWMAYDSQSDEEWLRYFAKQFGLRFARNNVKGSGYLPIWEIHFEVAQECYSSRNGKSGLKVAYFGDIHCSHSIAKNRIGDWFFEGAEYGARERTLRVSLLSGYSVEDYEREAGKNLLSQDSSELQKADDSFGKRSIRASENDAIGAAFNAGFSDGEAAAAGSGESAFDASFADGEAAAGL